MLDCYWSSVVERRGPGKIQYGGAWWYLDKKEGIELQLNALSNVGLLTRFVGMTTDSRSFLSYGRHECFRRTLCNLMGRDVVNGEFLHDMKLLGQVIRNVCYKNAKELFPKAAWKLRGISMNLFDHTR